MALLLKDKSDIKTAKTITSINPATLEILDDVEVFDKIRVQSRVNQAKHAFLSWSKLSLTERLEYIIRARDYILDNIDRICELISRENGKPLVEAISAELLPVLDLMDYYIKHKEKVFTYEEIALGKWSLLNKHSHIEYVV